MMVIGRSKSSCSLPWWDAGTVKGSSSAFTRSSMKVSRFRNGGGRFDLMGRRRLMGSFGGKFRYHLGENRVHHRLRVHDEVARQLVVRRLTQGGLADHATVEHHQLRARIGHQDRRMGRDDELRFTLQLQQPYDLQELQLPARRKGCLRLVQDVDRLAMKLVLE